MSEDPTPGPRRRPTCARDCHRKIHATWDNKTLARDWSTIEKLRGAPELESHLKWIRKQPGTRYFGSRDVKR